jgi:hypothetical protein
MSPGFIQSPRLSVCRYDFVRFSFEQLFLQQALHFPPFAPISDPIGQSSVDKQETRQYKRPPNQISAQPQIFGSSLAPSACKLAPRRNIGGALDSPRRMDINFRNGRFWARFRHWLNWREWTVPVLIGLAWLSLKQVSFLYSEESNLYVRQKRVDKA